ncbi:hypothetical protein [Nocardioides sp. B-3]|uniref:hypothetical protein n=1 Tax=Nocardioides sp. B-3 TaxID=2895565 RepID=UPI00215367B7|nr:hypothetical protein [Nocardioides sp. B-3]UUZ60844.1 hypothetical protein LP418_08955 [Nocardioides sp. B-3]
MYDHYDDHYPFPGYAPDEAYTQPGIDIADRLSHLVFVDGRLVDAWSEDVRRTRWERHAERFDEERRPRVVQSPPPPPRHEQVLEWLDSVVGGREAVLALGTAVSHVPMLRGVVDPVADEPWLIVDELLGDLCSSLLSPDLEAPMRRCLLLLRERCRSLPERSTPDRIAAGVARVVGKANAAIGPDGPVTQLSIAAQLGVASLNACGNNVVGHVRRVGWPSPRPWGSDCPPLLATGRAELLSARTVADLVELRDRALDDQAGSAAAVGP